MEPSSAPQEPTDTRREPVHRRSSTRNLVEWVLVIAGALLIAFLLRTFVFQTFFIPSASMAPTLEEGDRIIVNKLAGDFQSGDIVVFSRPEGWNTQHKDLIKRIIATGGETIEARDNVVYVDGEAIEESYLPEGTITSDFGPVTVPEGELFVMGDNRQHSQDSRVNVTVPESNVVGRAWLRVWPINRIGLL